MDYETTSTAQEILDTTATTPTGHSTGAVVAAGLGGLVTGIFGTIAAIKAWKIRKAEEKREAEKALIREVLAEMKECEEA